MDKITNWLFGKEIDHKDFLSANISAWTHQKKFGLVLGGGSARGIIHVGLVKYLIERDLFPSEIVGTSMGAIIGAGFALGFDAESMEKLLNDFSVMKFVDFHLGEGLIRGKKVLDYLDELFGYKSFEDCLIPLKVVTVDIDTGELVILSTGNIAKAVRASMSLPGIFSPVKIGENRLVDGGLVANLPVQVCSCNTVVACSSLGKLNEKVRLTKSGIFFVNTLSYLRSNKDILTKTVSLLIRQNEETSLRTPGKNIYLVQPEMNGLSFADFDHYKELVKKGYEEAERVLKTINF